MSFILTTPTIFTSIRLNLKAVDPETDTLLHTRLVRPQQSAMRLAYNRLLEGAKEKDIWQALRGLFPLLTGRNLNDAITLAKGTLESQQKLLPARLAKLDHRLERARNNLERELNRSKGPRSERVKAIQLAAQRLTRQRDELQVHLDRGTVPPAVFGQRKTWNKLPGSLAEWRHRRARQFFSKGACNQAGNSHCRLIVTQHGNLQLAVRIPTTLKQRGDQVTTAAKWLTFEVEYSRQYEAILRQVALAGAAKQASYDVRLMRLAVVIDEWIEEVGGGLNFRRSKFLALLERILRGEVELLVTAHPDRLARFGFDLIEYLCQRSGCEILVMNSEQLSPQEELAQDLLTIVHSFSARLSGLRHYKKKLQEALAVDQGAQDQAQPNL